MKFQFHSLLNQVWFKVINPVTIISGCCKVGVCPYNVTAIQPYSDAILAAMRLAGTRPAAMHGSAASPLLRNAQSLY